MTFILTVLRPDGSEHQQTMTIFPGLEQLQTAVGGYVEPVPAMTTYKGRPCQAFFDEDGRMKQLPVNWPATRLWHDALHSTGRPLREPLPEIVGNLLIICEDKTDGR